MLGELAAGDAGLVFLEEEGVEMMTLGLVFDGDEAAFLDDRPIDGDASVSFVDDVGVIVLGDCFLLGDGVLVLGVAAFA